MGPPTVATPTLFLRSSDAMNPPIARFHQDYVDPASYLVHVILRRLHVEVEPKPLELRQPPDPLIDPRDRGWREYMAEMGERAEALEAPFRPPPLVPWTRKAHELAAHAREKGGAAEVDRRIYDAYFAEGRDIGRVDILVEVGQAVGLDPTETKVALDVDRYGSQVEEERRQALEAGVRGVPTLAADHLTLEGFHPEEEIRTFLHPKTAR